VLVTGGRIQFGNTLASAELYNPASGTWLFTSSMNVPRDNHPATLLPDGRILVNGGVNDGDVERSAETYNPQSGTWAPVGLMAHERFNHKATLLPDGRVLAAGGAGMQGDCVPIGTAEIFDPQSNSWQPAGHLAVFRTFHGATLLGNGRVLVTGGYTGLNSAANPCLSATRRIEVYDPASGSWTTGGSMQLSRGGISSLARLSDGRVLVAGGRIFNSYLAAAEIYDPIVNSWLSAGSMSTPRNAPTLTTLLDGRVLVAGGANSTDTQASAELYTP
jgi:N-acetylneuraminic acid mutarotase